MKIRVFTLRLDPATGKFDDRELVEFQAGKDVLELSEHFLTHDRTPTLALVLKYRDLPDGARGPGFDARKDWRAEVDDGAKRIYDELRPWRGRKAKREVGCSRRTAVPPDGRPVLAAVAVPWSLSFRRSSARLAALSYATAWG